MDLTAKKQWVDALRSGKYPQGHETLRTLDDKFCCLGVLADVLRPDGWVLVEGPTRYGPAHWEYEGNPALLDDDFAGLRLHTQRVLASKNDGLDDEREHSFAEIADYIEKNL